MDYLSSRHDITIAQEICGIARTEYDKLLPQLPDIGGEAHPGVKWLRRAAQWIAFLRPMSARGHGAEETARMMYDLFMADLENISKDEMNQQGDTIFTQEYKDMMRAWSAHTKTQNGADWVVDFVPGDNTGVDYGLDFHHCPCLEFFKSQAAESIAPYFCLLDFPEHKLMGTGLRRTKTLAQGDDICNFRFQKGRAVTQDWSTEVPKFRQ